MRPSPLASPTLADAVKALLALVVTASPVLAPSPALAEPKVWTQDWEVSTRPVVHIRVDDAHVHIHAGPSGRVSSRVEYELKRSGMVFGTHSPTVVFERKGDEMWINARDPKGLTVIGIVDERFTVDVIVPRELTLTFHSSDGALDCEPLSGRFEFESGDGAVRATGLKGDVEVLTGDGRVTLAELNGKLSVRTGDGHVILNGRFDALDVTTRDGRVEATALPGSRVMSAWSLESSDGKVELRIPHDLAALLDARTRDGHVRVDLPIPVSEGRSRNTLVGELNGGGPALRIRTRDGGIVLALSD